MSKYIRFLASIFVLSPSLLIAGEPSSGTLIMISSIGAWVLVAGALIGFRRFRRARQQDRD